MSIHTKTVYLGDCIDEIVSLVERAATQPSHYCDTCGYDTPLPVGHPHCGTCESSLMLVQCKGCGQFFCKTGCAQAHSCGSGPEPQQIRRAQ